MIESRASSGAEDPRFIDGEAAVDDQSDSGSMLDLIDMQRLWQRAIELRYWLIGIVAVAVSLALLLTLLQTPQYRSTAQIEISRVDSGAVEIDETRAGSENRDRQYYETQYVLLESRFVAERVVEAENLLQDPAALEALGFPPEAKPNMRAVAGSLLGHMTITPLVGSDLVDISAQSSSAAVSAQLANAWAKQFLAANYDKRFGDTVDARRQLENQLAELRKKLEESEAELITFANANEIVVLEKGASGEGDGSGAGSEQTLVESQLANLNQALNDATARRIAAESAARALSGSSEGESSIRSSIAQVEASLARLRTTLGPENTQVRAAEAELRSLRSALSQQTGLTGSRLQAQLRAAQREEAELQKRFDDARNRYLAQQDQGVQYSILQREVSTNRELYNALLQRYKELGVTAAGRNNMALIQEAEVPGGPYSPSLIKNIVIALFAASLLCGILVFLRDILDNTVRDPSELRRRLGLPLIGLIPKVDPETVNDGLRNAHSELSEAYASARVAIDFATRADEKVLMITSTRPDEGKSLSSLAIAFNFARQGKKVLLIDMDLRRHGLSIRLNESKQETGMATYLAGQTENLPIFRQKEFGLDFIRSGKSTMSPADILATSRTEMALEQLKGMYDLVVIDAPPILGLADTPQLANSVDAIVYVVQANSSTFRSIKQALTRLRMSRNKIVGVLVTKLDRRNESYSYGYGYGYGYSYGSSAEQTTSA